MSTASPVGQCLTPHVLGHSLTQVAVIRELILALVSHLRSTLAGPATVVALVVPGATAAAASDYRLTKSTFHSKRSFPGLERRGL